MPNDPSEPTHETYEIETLQDMLQIPEDRIPAFCEDLKRMLETMQPVRRLLDIDLEELVGWDGVMHWHDDGQHNQHYDSNGQGEIAIIDNQDDETDA